MSETLDLLIVVAVLGVAAVVLARHFVHSRNTGPCGTLGGCASCGSSTAKASPPRSTSSLLSRRASR